MKFSILFLLLFSCINVEVTDPTQGEPATEKPNEEETETGPPLDDFEDDSGKTRWDINAFPIELKVSNVFSVEEKTEVTNMTTNWEEALTEETDIFTVNLSEGNTNKTLEDLNDYEDDEIGVYKLQDWHNDLPATALAVTQIFGLTNAAGSVRITHADILINYENYNFSLDPLDTENYHFSTNLLHELGHLLGLPHTGFENTSIMNPSISKSDNVTSLNQFDIDLINENYSYDNQLTQVQPISPKTFSNNGELIQKVKILIMTIARN